MKHSYVRALLLLAVMIAGCSYFTPSVRPEHSRTYILASGEVGTVCNGICVGECLPIPTPTPTPIPQPPTGINGPRGMSCLHCTLPKARLSADAVVSTVQKANLPEPMLTFLVSGTFGWNFNYVKEAAQRIKTESNRPVFGLYWQSGPSQRRYQSGFFNGIGDKTAPAIWNQQLKTSPAVRAQVSIHLQNVAALAHYLVSIGIRPVVAALEDNFDDSTAKAVEGLIAQAGFPAETRYTRNANGYVPTGWKRERHGSGRAVCQAEGEVWSNDGYSMDAIPLESISYFGECDRVHGLATLHIQKNQGVQTGATFKPVEDRTYHIMSEAEQNHIANILKQVFPTPSAALKAACPNGFIPVQYPVLYKEESDGTNPPRLGKPGFLAPDIQMIRGSSLVYNNEGKSVARFGWYGDFQQAWERSYICWSGGSCETREQLAIKASPAYIQARNGQCFGPLYSPLFRQGAVR